MKQINLLPKPKQEELRYEIIFYSFVRCIVVCSVLFAFILGVQFASRLYIEQLTANATLGIEQLQKKANKQEDTSIKDKIQGINNFLFDYNILGSLTPHWSRALYSFVVLIPNDVKIATFNGDLSKNKIDISGFSPTREAVIALYNNIKSDGANFLNIDYPLENVAKPTNIRFHFTFYIKDTLLK